MYVLRHSVQIYLLLFIDKVSDKLRVFFQSLAYLLRLVAVVGRYAQIEQLEALHRVLIAIEGRHLGNRIVIPEFEYGGAFEDEIIVLHSQGRSF